MTILSLHREELEPCYSCQFGARVPHTINGEFIGETVTCLCPLKDDKGRCACQYDPPTTAPNAPPIIGADGWGRA